jgi:hypothetical protein
MGIIAFGVATSFGQDKWYPGFSLAMMVIIVEMTWILFVKYRETHYTFTTSVVTIMIAIVGFFFAWMAIYAVFVVRTSTDVEDKDFHASLVMFIGLGYSLFVFIGLIMGEYSAKSAANDVYTCSFKVIALIAFLLASAVGVSAVMLLNQVFFGVWWLSSLTYLGL